MMRHRQKDNVAEGLAEVKTLLIQLQAIAQLALTKADALAVKLELPEGNDVGR